MIATGDTPTAVSVVIVSYRCLDDLHRCLDSVYRESKGIEVDVTVVDNASGDGTDVMVRSCFPEVAFIENDTNVGFAAANNQALTHIRGRFAFLLNPDAQLAQGALSAMLEYMGSHPEIGVLAPLLLNSDGSIQHSIRRFPTIPSALFETLFLHRLLPALTSRVGEVVLDQRAYETTHPLEWASGAAMFVRREVIDAVGPLDADFFLFAEELDWFKRMHDQGVGMRFFPGAKVYHRHEADQLNPELTGQNAYARDQYWRKHATPLVAGTARSLLVASMGLRVAIWWAAARLGRGQAAARCVAYQRGLSDFLAGRTLLDKGGVA